MSSSRDPDVSGPSSSSSSSSNAAAMAPPPRLAHAAAANPGLMASPLVRSQLLSGHAHGSLSSSAGPSSAESGFARPGLPASAGTSAFKPKPSDYAPDKRIGLSSAAPDSPYKRRKTRFHVDPSTTTFKELKREIMERTQGPQDEAIVREWAASEAYARLLDYVQDLNDAIRGVRVPVPGDPPEGNGGIVCETMEEFDGKVAEWLDGKPDSVPQVVYRSPNVKALENLLDAIDAITDAVPVREARNRRFGDTAFRDWIDKLASLVDPADESGDSASKGLLHDLLPEEMQPAIVELAPYLLSSFGDRQRIDYGTGHELSFLAFLVSLSLLGFLAKEDDRATALLVFPRYLATCRKVQRKYFLEPAGSHGVWGLDDHQFLPYLWGSAQLAGDRRLPPRTAPDPKTAEKHAQEYLYLAAIHHIHTTKRGPFNEHSPLLYDISGLPDWNRVNSGLLRMWCGEVLGKRVVVQHLGFGELLPWRAGVFEEA